MRLYCCSFRSNVRCSRGKQKRTTVYQHLMREHPEQRNNVATSGFADSKTLSEEAHLQHRDTHDTYVPVHKDSAVRDVDVAIAWSSMSLRTD